MKLRVVWAGLAFVLLCTGVYLASVLTGHEPAMPLNSPEYRTTDWRDQLPPPPQRRDLPTGAATNLTPHTMVPPKLDSESDIFILIESFVALCEAGNGKAAREAFAALETGGTPVRGAARRLFFDDHGNPRAEHKQAFVRNFCLIALLGSNGPQEVLQLILERWKALDPTADRAVAWKEADKRALEFLAAAALPDADKALIDAAGAAVEYLDGDSLQASATLFQFIELRVRSSAAEHLVVDPVTSQLLVRCCDPSRAPSAKLDAIRPLLRLLRNSEQLSMRLRIQAAKLLAEPATDVLDLADRVRSALAKDEATKLLVEYLKTRPIPGAEDWQLLLASLFSRWDRADVWWILNDACMASKGSLFEDSTRGEELAEALTLATISDSPDSQKLANIGALVSLLTARRGARSKSGASLARYNLMGRTTASAESFASEILRLLGSFPQGGISEDQFSKLLNDAGRIFLELPLPMVRRLELCDRLPPMARSLPEKRLLFSALFGSLTARSESDLLDGGQVLFERIPSWLMQFVEEFPSPAGTLEGMFLRVAVACCQRCIVVQGFPALSTDCCSAFRTVLSLAHGTCNQHGVAESSKDPLGMLYQSYREFETLLRQSYPDQFK